VRKRPLGKTGLYVSEMSVGTWGLSGDAYGAVTEKDAEATLLRCVEMGMTLVDTADAYGGGKMEALLGRLFSKRDDIIIVTKGGTDRTTEPPRKRFEAQYLRDSVERSRKRLRRDVLDLYLLHNPSADALVGGEAVETMEGLVLAKKIAHWGVAAGDEVVARAAIDRGAEVIELAYNLVHSIDLHRVAGDVMVSGAGVLARSTLAHGMLSGTWAKDREFDESDHRRDRWTRLELQARLEQLEKLQFLTAGDVKTLRAAAIRFALANTLVSSAVLGPRSVAQAEELVRETGGGPRYLPDEALLRLPRVLAKAGILT